MGTTLGRRIEMSFVKSGHGLERRTPTFHNHLKEGSITRSKMDVCKRIQTFLAFYSMPLRSLEEKVCFSLLQEVGIKVLSVARALLLLKLRNKEDAESAGFAFIYFVACINHSVEFDKEPE